LHSLDPRDAPQQHEHTMQLVDGKRFTRRIMPWCKRPLPITNSPKSLSKVTNTRPSDCAAERISSSPGSRGQSIAAVTSCPAATRAERTTPATHESSRTFTSRCRQTLVRDVRGRQAAERKADRLEYHRPPARGSSRESSRPNRPPRAFPTHALLPAAVRE